MNRLRKIFLAASKNARQKRAEIFRRRFAFDKTIKILDIGSENGENIRQVIAGTKILPENVYIADIDLQAIEGGRKKFNFRPVLLSEESGALPFADGFFDIVYCSSVIEHVTLPKEKTWKILSEGEFRRRAWENQKRFANEIRRVGRQYFVQTPAKNFPLESHTWLPFYSFLPRPLQVEIMKQTNKFWIKGAIPDFNLLGAQEMTELFPDAEIVFEKKLGLVKSIMAIKSSGDKFEKES